MTYASRVTPPGATHRPFGDGTAKAVIAGIAGTKDLKATKSASVKIDGHKGRSTDVTPIGSGRRAVFTAGGKTFYVEGGRTTRIVALDTEDGPLVLVIEPASGHTLRQVLGTADVVASTLTFR